MIVSALLVALAVLCDSRSFAAPPPDNEPLRVDLTAPEACPTRPTLFDRVRSHTSRVRPASPGERSRALHVVIAPEGDRFVAHVRLIEESEALERRVPGKTCEEVLAAVALITALMIDPLATTVPTDAGTADVEEHVVDASRAPERAAPKPATFEVDAGPPAPQRTHAHATIGTSVEAHGLGEAVLGRSLWIEGSMRSPLSPALRLRLARTQSFTAVRDLHPAFFKLTTAAMEGCFTALRSEAELVTGAVELRPCVQVTGGVLEGTSSAFGPAHRMSRPWAGLGALAQARWRFFGPLELEAALGLTLPLVRDNFFFLPRNDVYRAPGVVLLGNVGVGTTFR